MYKNKISAVYKIVNTITNDCYVGSSKNVFHRWANHKCQSEWKKQPNNPLYLDMQKYGVDNFRFQILAPVMPEYLKQVEQELIEMIHPTYNNYMAKGIDAERQKESHRKADRKYQMKYSSQLCLYNVETVRLGTLANQFQKAGVEHPVLEAKKYILDLEK